MTEKQIQAVVLFVLATLVLMAAAQRWYAATQNLTR